MRRALRLSRVLAAGVLIAAAPAGAQVIRDSAGVPPPALAGPRTLVGIVSDTSGTPVDSVELRIQSLERAARSGSDGRFRFDDVKPGTYSVSARRLGYLPQVRRVIVGANGGSTSFSLVPHVRGLPASVTSAARGGLSGVVGDTAYAIVPGAIVDVLGTGKRGTSDSTGAFFVDVKPGHYMVRVTRAGFAPQMTSVTVPADSGRRVVFWLTPATRVNGREAFNAAELRLRMDTMHTARSRIFTHEDILRLNPASSIQLATMGAVRAVNLDCAATLDGGPFSVPLWSFDPDEIEFLEVYTSGPARQTPSLRSGRSSAAMRNIGMNTCPTIYVWLRK